MERVRKQVYLLTSADLAAFAVWEFALDEEGEAGQDEATVRPHPFEGEVDCNVGMLIVRARFTFADGTVMSGYLTPPVQGDAGLGTLQPVIITPGGQVGFWCGLRAPDSTAIEQDYRILGRAKPEEVFPVRFQSDIPLSCGELGGEIPGFLVIEDLKTRRIRVVK
jgi:hypothetical protein